MLDGHRVSTPNNQHSTLNPDKPYLSNQLVRIGNLLIALAGGQLLRGRRSDAGNFGNVPRDGPADKVHHCVIVDARTLRIVPLISLKLDVVEFVCCVLDDECD